MEEMFIHGCKEFFLIGGEIEEEIQSSNLHVFQL